MPRKKDIKNALIKNPTNEHQLNPKQVEFCKAYFSVDILGNGTEAYSRAYGIDMDKPGGYMVCANAASKLLKNPRICAYLTAQLDAIGLNDIHVDKQLLWALTQNADIGAKVAGIREHNKIKGRITEGNTTLINGDVNITMNLDR